MVKKTTSKRGSKSKMESQSAMEYMTTHAWMILIISVVVIALFGLGVFQGLGAASGGNICTPVSGYVCGVVSFSTFGVVNVTVTQSKQTITVTATSCTNSSTSPGTFTPINPSVSLPPGKTVTLLAQCPIAASPIGTQYSGTLWITYNTSLRSGLISPIGTFATTVSTAGSSGGVGGSSSVSTTSTGSSTLSSTATTTSTAAPTTTPTASTTSITESTTTVAPTIMTFNTLITNGTESPANALVLPITGSYQVNWGDGTGITSNTATHAYAVGGIYTVDIIGTGTGITGFRYDYGGDALKLISISQWGACTLGIPVITLPELQI